METNVTLMSFIVFVLSMIGYAYGTHFFLVKRKALYTQMITAAVGCFMFSSLFEFLFLLAHKQAIVGFHVGMIGVIGGFFFFFTANYGQMDGLVDDRSNKFLKTRLIALIDPIVIIALYVVFFILVKNTELRVVIGIVAMFIATSGYYNFKHIIIYDVELGIVDQIRLYNVLASVSGVLAMLRYIGQYAKINWLYYASSIAVAIVIMLITPVLKKGVMRWTI